MGADLVFLVTIVAFVVIVFAMINHEINVIHDGRLRALAAERPGETICQFARSLDYRSLDTKVIRAVHEAVQVHTGTGFPIRASDDLVETRGIDGEDVEWMVVAIANRHGRSLDGSEHNPHHERAFTAGGMVEFLCARPRVGAR